MMNRAVASIARSLTAKAATVAAPASVAAFSTVGAAVRRAAASVQPYSDAAADSAEFPRERPGLDYSLNWSLADDGVTPTGDAFRNASVKHLLMYSAGSLSKSKALLASRAFVSAPRFATDEYDGFAVMGIDEYEERSEALRDGFAGASQLFVQDGAVGSTRESEIRVRVISDSAEYALAFQNLLVATPLLSAEGFPRPVVVYINTSAAGPAFTASDFDAETGKATVIASGSVSLADLRDQVAHAAAQLADAGGYRHVKGGGPRVQAARERGNIEWYIDDRHHTASADEAHPDLLLLRANATVKDGAVTLQVGAQPDGAVFAGHHVMWTPAGVARVWDGVSTAAAHGDDLPRGALTMGGETTQPLSAGRSAGHPSKVLVAGGKDLAAALQLTPSQTEKLNARLEEHKVSVASL